MKADTRPSRQGRRRFPAVGLALLGAGGLAAPATVAAQGMNPGLVIVTNPRSDPVLTRDVDTPAKDPFQIQLPLAIAAGAGAPNATFTVPAGKRLVIEYVSAMGNVPVGQRVQFVNVNTFSGGTVVFHFLRASETGTNAFSPGVGYVANETVRFYADPGTQVLVAVNRSDSTGTGMFTIAISGHLVTP